jgi:hypothetical protein
MKYSKKTLAGLTNELAAVIDQGFRFELTQSEITKNVNQFFDSHFLTDTGKKRYPDYFRISLNAFCYEFSNLRMSENTLFCYLVDNVLYTTYKKSASYFKGEVTLPSYKSDPTIEDKILYAKGNITNGYYYNSGKPHFIKTVI